MTPEREERQTEGVRGLGCRQGDSKADFFVEGCAKINLFSQWGSLELLVCASDDDMGFGRPVRACVPCSWMKADSCPWNPGERWGQLASCFGRRASQRELLRFYRAKNVSFLWTRGGGGLFRKNTAIWNRTCMGSCSKQNNGSPKGVHIPLCLEPGKRICYLTWQRAFADVIKDLDLGKISRVIWWSPMWSQEFL